MSPRSLVAARRTASPFCCAWQVTAAAAAAVSPMAYAGDRLVDPSDLAHQVCSSPLRLQSILPKPWHGARHSVCCKLSVSQAARLHGGKEQFEDQRRGLYARCGCQWHVTPFPEKRPASDSAARSHRRADAGCGRSAGAQPAGAGADAGGGLREAAAGRLPPRGQRQQARHALSHPCCISAPLIPSTNPTHCLVPEDSAKHWTGCGC